MSTTLKLREVELSDADILLKWFKDSQNVKYMSTIFRGQVHTRESIDEMIMEIDGDYERLYIILLDGTPIGHAGIDDIDFVDRRAELFVLIGEPEYRGKGYAKETIRQLLEISFSGLKLHSVYATAAAENPASIRTIENAGFKRIGIRRDYNLIDGKFIDEILFDMIDTEYFERCTPSS